MDYKQHILKLCEAILLITLSLGVQSHTAQAQLQCVGPLKARAPQRKVWIRGTQICPCNFGLKRATETGARAVLCELLLHPAQAIQASHRSRYTPGLLKHGEKWALLTAPLRVSCTPNSCSTEHLGVASITAFPFQLHCSRRDILQVELQPPAGLPSRSCWCCWHCWKGRMDTSQDMDPVEQR